MDTQTHGIHGVTAEDVFIGNGVSELILMTLEALLEPGDEVLIPAPDYPLWTAAVVITGAKPVYYQCRPEAGFIPDPEEVARLVTPRCKALVLINPPVARNEQPDPNPLIRFPRFWAWLARAGILRGTGTISRMAAGLPPPAGGALAAFLNRPDHLTRSADELSHWDDVIGLAATASLNLDMPVVRVDVAGSQRVAFLTGESEAAPVVAAILNAVGDARRNR